MDNRRIREPHRRYRTCYDRISSTADSSSSEAANPAESNTMSHARSIIRLKCTHVRNVMTTESNEISLLLRNFDRQFAVVPTRADQGPRLPDLTDEVVWLGKKRHSNEFKNTFARGSLHTSPAGTSTSVAPWTRGSTTCTKAKLGCLSAICWTT